jgi:hypothetical protein
MVGVVFTENSEPSANEAEERPACPAGWLGFDINSASGPGSIGLEGKNCMIGKVSRIQHHHLLPNFQYPWGTGTVKLGRSELAVIP